MKLYLLIYVGCIECGEDSFVKRFANLRAAQKYAEESLHCTDSIRVLSEADIVNGSVVNTTYSNSAFIVEI